MIGITPLTGCTKLIRSTLSDLRSRALTHIWTTSGQIHATPSYLAPFPKRPGTIWSAPAERSGDGALDQVIDRALSETVTQCMRDPKRRRRSALPAHSKLTADANG